MPEHEYLSESDDVARTIGASLNSVCNRFADTAPSDASVELDVGVVRWSMSSVEADEVREGISSNTGEDGLPLRTLASFERETAAGVSKAMKRKIAARFSKKIKDGIATDVFVLETIPRKN
jgi:hypothetical protein